MIKFKLEELLNEKNISRYRLTKEVGTDSKTINRIFNNDTTSIKLDILEKICVALDCKIEDLMYIEK